MLAQDKTRVAELFGRAPHVSYVPDVGAQHSCGRSAQVRVGIGSRRAALRRILGETVFFVALPLRNDGARYGETARCVLRGAEERKGN